MNVLSVSPLFYETEAKTDFEIVIMVLIWLDLKEQQSLLQVIGKQASSTQSNLEWILFKSTASVCLRYSEGSAVIRTSALL